MDSTLVIKAKYGDTMRRFNAPINENGLLDLDMSGLRTKILGLFNFSPDADVILTYVDEDGDVVTLVDDDDLVDVMKQSLKFLRVDVQLRNDKVSKSSASNSKSSTSSTPMRSPRVHTPLHDIHAGVADVLKSAGVADVLKSTGVADLLKAVPEHLLEALSKLSLELASKAACSNSAVAELKSFLNSAQQSPDGANSSINAGNVENPMTSGGSSVPNAATTNHKTTQDLKVENVTRGVGVSIKPASAPVDLNLNPPCDSNPSGCATYFGQTVNCDDRKEKRKQNVGRSNISIHFGPPASASDSARPLGSECPFSGMPAANDSSAPPFILPRIAPFKRSCGRNDALGGSFHRGVQCDGCGVHPITGPRYKSKVREDYDLCSICFSDMGNEADYIKIDRPVSYRHSRPFKGLHDPVYWVGSTPTHAMRHCGLKPVRSKLDSRFISDVNVLDGTMMAPSTPFTKIWRLRNSGSVAWPQGSRLVWIGGDKFSHADSTELEIPESGVPVDGEIDVAVDFTSPKFTGRYLSYWRMASPSGTKFGQRVWVLIHVVASTNEALSDGVQVLNLNFPPDFSGSKYPEVIDVNVQPVMDSRIVESGVPTPTSTSVSVPMTIRPTFDVEPAKKDQEINFSMNDPILVGNGVSTFTSPQASPSVSYPIIDLSEAGPSVAIPAVDVLKSFEETNLKDDVEMSLLKELEEMGFKQVDLNKEVLRMNEYDLEQAVDDLCGVSEWDPILEELQEMGFRDEEMNRKLLKKNNGSIKGVVMDLLTGEKA